MVYTIIYYAVMYPKQSGITEGRPSLVGDSVSRRYNPVKFEAMSPASDYDSGRNVL